MFGGLLVAQGPEKGLRARKRWGNHLPWGNPIWQGATQSRRGNPSALRQCLCPWGNPFDSRATPLLGAAPLPRGIALPPRPTGADGSKGAFVRNWAPFLGGACRILPAGLVNTFVTIYGGPQNANPMFILL